ncbi:MAG: FAD:protein FMN transferase [Eubacterium sp.]|jgi:thiamine biosynthesis lipoprotein|nr:FAD:protein FMN transferase [Eubacterium sp.]
MGTIMNIAIYDIDVNTAKSAINEAKEYIEKLENLTSAKLQHSGLSLINSDTGENPLVVDGELYDLLEMSSDMSKATEGAFDITLLNLAALWSVEQKMKSESEIHNIPSEYEIKQTLSRCGYKNLKVNNGKVWLNNDIKIDLGAVAKGYAADNAIEILKRHGVSSAILNLGGNVYVLGKNKNSNWSVGITDPLNPSEICAIIKTSDKAVVTSANYERYFEINGKRYHHIFDSRTGYPAESGIISVTVIGDSSTLCDMLSTAFFVMGAEKAAKFKEKHKIDVDYIIINKEGEHILSEGFSLEYEKPLKK